MMQKPAGWHCGNEFYAVGPRALGCGAVRWRGIFDGGFSYVVCVGDFWKLRTLEMCAVAWSMCHFRLFGVSLEVQSLTQTQVGLWGVGSRISGFIGLDACQSQSRV